MIEIPMLEGTSADSARYGHYKSRDKVGILVWA